MEPVSMTETRGKEYCGRKACASMKTENKEEEEEESWRKEDDRVKRGWHLERNIDEKYAGCVVEFLLLLHEVGQSEKKKKKEHTYTHNTTPNTIEASQLVASFRDE